MRWDDLAVLLEVSRVPTMTEAAERLGGDQTTISRRLRAFEARVGVQLAVRGRTGIELTEAGLKAARAAEVMETVSQDLERSLLGADARLAGRLRITTVPLVAHHHATLFTSFGQRYPLVTLQVETLSSTRSLARGQADIALRWTRLPNPELVGRKLAEVAFAPYAHARLAGQYGDDLASYPWVAFLPNGPEPAVDRFMSSLGPDARVICLYEEVAPLLAAVRAGAGAGLLPCAFADTDPDLVRLTSVLPDLRFDFWALTHPDLRATARVRTFLKHAGAYFDDLSDVYRVAGSG